MTKNLEDLSEITGFYKIYCLIEDETNEPFYIGSTNQALKMRFNVHIKNAKTGKSKLSNYINKIISLGKTFSIKLIEVLESKGLTMSESASKLLELEYLTIIKYMSDGHILYNTYDPTRKIENSIFIPIQNFETIVNFNKNIEWLRKTKQSVPIENDAWIYLSEAEKILNRRRTWIATRRIDKVVEPMNTNWYLIKGIDWDYEGKNLVFLKSSVTRLKSEMIRMGAAETSEF